MTPILPAYRKSSWLWGVLAIAGVVLLAGRYLEMAVALGQTIPTSDLATDYVKGVVWALFLGGTILLWPVSSANKRLLLCAWLAKIAVTLFFMLFYENYYGLDAYMYFDESHKADFNFSELNLLKGLGTENMVSLARLHRQFLPDSYHAMKVSCAMLGLIGIYLFYRAAVIFMQREMPRFFLLLALFPGIIFWSSILGKDPVAFFGIALYAYGVSGWYRYKRVWFLPIICAGILTAIFIRQWLGLIMVVPMGIVFFIGLRGVFLRLFFGLFSIMVGYFSAQPFMTRFKIQALQDVLTAADRVTTGFVTTAGGSTQVLNFDFSSPSGLLSFLPYAAFTAVFRPFPGEVMNPFGLLAGLESAILLFLLARAIMRTKLSELREPLVLWAILFVTVWAVINGLVSSANFGVGVRYKLQILPILLGVLMFLARDRINEQGD